jgi:hypothetical protein
MLKGGDRAVGIGEGGSEMGEDMCRGSACRFGRQIGGWAARRQRRANSALAQIESFPEALPGPVAAPAIGNNADRRRDAVGDGDLKESPQSAGGQASASDLVGEPDAEGPPATQAPIAIAAEDSPRADRLSLRVTLIEAAQITMADQRANSLAVRTRRQLELLRHRVPFRLRAEKPMLLAHVPDAPRKSPSYERKKARGSGGVR